MNFIIFINFLGAILVAVCGVSLFLHGTHNFSPIISIFNYMYFIILFFMENFLQMEHALSKYYLNILLNPTTFEKVAFLNSESISEYKVLVYQYNQKKIKWHVVVCLFSVFNGVISILFTEYFNTKKMYPLLNQLLSIYIKSIWYCCNGPSATNYLSFLLIFDYL